MCADGSIVPFAVPRFKSKAVTPGDVGEPGATGAGRFSLAFPPDGAAPVSHTTGARTPRTQPLISSVAIRSTPGWPVSGAGPGCGPTLASNDAARPTLGLPLLVALRAQVTTGHSVGRGHSPLMLWAARASVACSCSRSGASPPLLDNAFRRDLLWRFCR